MDRAKQRKLEARERRLTSLSTMFGGHVDVKEEPVVVEIPEPEVPKKRAYTKSATSLQKKRKNTMNLTGTEKVTVKGKE